MINVGVEWIKAFEECAGAVVSCILFEDLFYLIHINEECSVVQTGHCEQIEMPAYHLCE